MDRAMIRESIKIGVDIVKNEPELWDDIGNLLFPVFMVALNKALTYEINMIDGKSQPGRQIEKTVNVNVIKFLAEYIPGIEARLEGNQADTGKAMNAATQARDGVKQVYNITALCAEVFQRMLHDNREVLRQFNIITPLAPVIDGGQGPQQLDKPKPRKD